MTINTICICGAGTMGTGIAFTVAKAGFFVLLYDLDFSSLEKAKTSIETMLYQWQNKSMLNEKEAAELRNRIQYTHDVQQCLADIFIEAIAEKHDQKAALFNQLAEINHSECIFASNTSSLSITSIARQVRGPERVIGMHFFNPAPVMKLVEVVHTGITSPETTQAIMELARCMGKVPVLCTDSPGFIVNRVARPYYLEALRLAEKNNNYQQTDYILEATGYKMGPFRLMDLIGNDISYSVSCSIYERLGKPERLKPSPVQEQKVKEGSLGRKSGTGFYKYE